MGKLRKFPSGNKYKIVVKRVFAIIVLSLLISCSEEQRVEQTQFVLNVEVDQAAPESKAVLTGKQFGSGETIGLFVYYGQEGVYPHTSLMPYSDRYKNVRAVRETVATREGNWRYKFNGSDGEFYNFYFMSPSLEALGQGLTIYAYAPYIKGTESIDNIPFTLGGNYNGLIDLMYAKQNSESVNACLLPEGGTHEVTLTFRHSLALLNFRLKCMYAPTTMTVDAITLQKASDSEGYSPLYVSGKYNALTNEFHGLQQGQIRTNYRYGNTTNEFDSNNYKDYLFTIVPNLPLDPSLPFDPENNPQMSYVDESYEVVFTLNGHTLEYRYKIRAEDLLSDGGTGAPVFEAGKTYTFNFIVDNYIHLDGVNVSDTWPDEVESIEIKF